MAEKENLSVSSESKAEKRRREEMNSSSKRKRQNRIIGIVLAVCVVIGVALSLIEGNLIYRSIKAVSVDDTEYTVAEYNWLYTNSFFEVYENLTNSYGDYASYIMDPSKPLKDQRYSEDQTWEDYMRDYTKQSLINMTSLYDEAKENGWTLDESYVDMIDSEWETLKSSAAQYGVTPASYLVSAYGRGVNEKVYRDMYERYFYAYSYGNSVREGFEISDADIDARYNEDPKAIDQVSFNYIFIAANEDENAQPTDAQKAEEAKNAESLESYAEGIEATYNSVRGIRYSSADTSYADWLFDGARTAGEREVFETETGIYVVEFVEKLDLHYNTRTMRHILVKPADTESEDSWNEAKEKLDGYVNTWNELGGGEDYFSYVAMAYSEDEGSKANGGYYTDIYKGQMVQEIEDWIFDPARNPGDTETIRTSYGYHYVYFVSEDDEYYHETIDTLIRNEKYEEYTNEINSGYEVTPLDGLKYTANNH